MSTVPVPAGDVIVILVAELTVKPVPEVEPNRTDVASVNSVPVTVTVVPPEVEPWFGETTVTVGAPRYVNWLAVDVALVPASVVTVTYTLPAVPAGEVAVIVVAEFTV